MHIGVFEVGEMDLSVTNDNIFLLQQMSVAKETKNGHGLAYQKSLCGPHYQHST